MYTFITKLHLLYKPERQQFQKSVRDYIYWVARIHFNEKISNRSLQGRLVMDGHVYIYRGRHLYQQKNKR